ncbi:MAG TPA: NAD-glutamate dehydrogenase, partial [Mycobacteriales bacterium]
MQPRELTEDGGVGALLAAATQDPETERLLWAYWRMVPADELGDRKPDDLLTALTSHRDLAADRLPGQTLLRVSTPDPTSASWAGRHTVIELVTDDMPFLVDSITAELARRDLGVHLLVHPQLVVRRGGGGALAEVRADVDPEHAGPGDIVESWMHIEVDRTSDDTRLAALGAGLERVLGDVRLAFEDWRAMRDKAVSLAADLAETPLPVPREDTEDARELLCWLADDHFTFLGYREYRLTGGDEVLEAIPSTGLGILRDAPATPRTFASMPADARARALEQRLLVITKANTKATVHRSSYLDYIGVKCFDADGRVTGERRFLGLFSEAAYLESVRKLPVVRRKVAEVIAGSGLSVRSHSGKDLLSVLETYPRDELFQSTSEELTHIGMGVLRLTGRRQLRLFLRRDAYGRFISCLVYLPRDRYSTQVRLRMQRILTEELNGVGVEYTTRVTESVLARVHFIVRTDPANPPDGVDVAALQDLLTEVARSWDDDLVGAVTDAVGEEQARPLLDRYARAFPEAYKERHTVDDAVDDVARLEMLEDAGDLGTHLYQRDTPAGPELRFTVARLHEPMLLSDVLPVLQSLGVRVVDEFPYRIERGGGPDRGGDVAWVYDFGLDDAGATDLERVHRAVENAFAAAWRGDSEVDGLNALVLAAGLTWQQVVVLRAYAKYLRQAGTIYSNQLIESTLAGNPGVARRLVDLFEARFDPDKGGTWEDRQGLADALVEAIEADLDAVASLDADRILRSLLAMVLATLRTNRYRRGRRTETSLALKIDPGSVPDLPRPRPKFEIFVYSPRFEGVHLRFGAVARGGLRWSDRRDDFRTEILGLVKAQMVKNSVIVPVGAKGGFVLKRPPADREAFRAEGVACYTAFISALLDVTDNIHTTAEGSTVVPPPGVVRHDGDDPYLVVAADKGTATFSDLANGVAREYGHWLGDAFASGGSAGYDHKGMGITARGAWESVRRHFRERGLDTQGDDFTVVGIGDMSGDVFGNGMLLSEHIRLVAAFDHRHVFLDPEPDAATTFAERRRLFAVPRSSWADYDTSLISAGGGVWPRTAKSIPVSPQVRRALGIEDPYVVALSPAELIRRILTAPVDLLWNGGIGTYVKATAETHSDVGDKTNDPVRVNGADLRAAVVGEGGNLGLTQRGRIEYASAGGRINTDAIDNSAGVDTSDHEVNIKILLDRAVTAGELAAEDRNPLLAEMTDEVGALVLADNYGQNIALGNARSQSERLITVHARLIRELERSGRLDRAIEFLPSDKVISEREAAGRGLTSPELSVLLAYVKISLEEEVLASGLPDEQRCLDILSDYFPTALRARFRDQMEAHPLRREIITTQVVNDAVNRGGSTFVFRAVEETGATALDVIRAYLVVREVFGLPAMWAEIEALDNGVPTAAQTSLFMELRRLLDRAVRWLVQNRRAPIDVSGELARLGPGVAALLPEVGALFCGAEADALAAHVEGLVAGGAPRELSRRITEMLYGFGLLDVVEVATKTERPLAEVAPVYYRLSERFRVDVLLDRISALPRDDRWQSLARMALRYDLYAALSELTAEVLVSTAPGAGSAERVDTWMAANASSIAQAQQNVEEFRADAKADLATLSVILRQV